MHGIVLLGAPGAGKGTQAVLLSKDLGFAHISSGDLFRENMRAGTPLGLMAQDYINRGELVPDDVTVNMVRERLRHPDCAEGFLLDGFPRTIPQANMLDRMLDELGRCVTMVLNMQVRQSMLMERLSHRWTCRACGAVFPYEAIPPREGCKKAVCDGELYQRADDTPETQLRRIEVYVAQTAPLIEFYRARGVLTELSGEHTIEFVHRELLDTIRSTPGCD